MAVNALTFEQRLAKAWLESGFSETDFRELIESHSNLTKNVDKIFFSFAIQTFYTCDEIVSKWSDSLRLTHL